jgi:hypothetical protein
MKNFIFILLCFLVRLQVTAEPSPMATPEETDFSQRMRKLEAFQENLQKEVALHASSLDNKFTALETKLSNNFYILLISLGGGTLTLLGGFILGIRNTRKAMLDSAEQIVHKEVDKALPIETQKKVRQFIETTFPQHIAPLLAAAEQERTKLHLLSSTPVYILAESNTQSIGLKNHMLEKGFKQVEILVPKVAKDLPQAGLFVIDRQGNSPEGDWKYISDQKIIDLFRAYSNNLEVRFCYYGQINTSLNLKMHRRLGFATYEAKLVDNILQLLQNASSK